MATEVGRRVRGVLLAVVDRTISALALKHKTWTARDKLDAAMGVALFLSSAIALGSWFRYVHHQVNVCVPLIWTLLGLASILIAPRKRLLLIGALGLYVVYGLKAVVLDRDPQAWYVVVGALALAAVLVATGRRQPS
jgi:hypothetical protein